MASYWMRRRALLGRSLSLPLVPALGQVFAHQAQGAGRSREAAALGEQGVPLPPGTVLARAQDAFVVQDDSGATWFIGNAAVLRIVRLDGGTLATMALVERSSGDSWLIPGREFVLDAGSGALDGGAGWALAGVEAAPAGPARCELHLRLRPTAAEAPPIELLVGYGVYAGSPAVEQWLELLNAGSQALQVRALAPAALHIAHGEEARWQCYTVPRRGPQIKRTDLAGDAQARIAGTLTESLETPWLPLFYLRDGSTEAGLFVGWAWSHEFDVTLAAAGPDVEVQAAHRLGEGWPLGPGERMPSFRFFLGLFRGDLEDGGRAMRRFTEQHVIPPAPPDWPPADWNSYAGLKLEVRLPYLYQEAELAASLGLELFLVDHGWEREAGDWQPREELYGPNGIELRRLADYVHSLGMKFGLWVDLGEAAPTAPILREHPEYLARAVGKAAQGYLGAKLLCLHVAGDWVASELIRLIDTYRLDWLKFDQPQIAPCVDPRHGHGTSPEAGGYANVLALYRVLDRVRRERPQVVLENCYSGVGYLDFGMMARTDVCWLTDDGVDGRAAKSHLQQLYRFAAMAAPLRYLHLWASGPVGSTLEEQAYLAAANMSGMWGLSYRLGTFTDETLGLLRRLVTLYKRVRPLLRDGEAVFLFPNGRAPAWYGVQYLARDAARTAVLLLRNPGPANRTTDPQTAAVELRGLDAAGQYRVWLEAATGEPVELGSFDGAALMDGAVSVTLPLPAVRWLFAERL